MLMALSVAIVRQKSVTDFDVRCPDIGHRQRDLLRCQSLQQHLLNQGVYRQRPHLLAARAAIVGLICIALIERVVAVWSGIDAKKLRVDLAFRGTATVIPTNPTHKHQWSINRETYKARNLVERTWCRIKDFRRIATRYDKLARNYASSVALAAVIIWWTD